jgi:hypothetical protein
MEASAEGPLLVAEGTPVAPPEGEVLEATGAGAGKAHVRRDPASLQLVVFNTSEMKSPVQLLVL